MPASYYLLDTLVISLRLSLGFTGIGCDWRGVGGKGGGNVALFSVWEREGGEGA